MLVGVALAAAALALLPFLRGDGVAGSRDYDLATHPLYLGGNAVPLMMLVASRDEQLFDKAYADYTDLDGDGVVDSTYNNKFDYEGYFDPFLCYAHDGNVFTATGNRNTDHKCSGAWSGNFLNWVTMSRVDMLRYVLYGGNRSTDVAGRTVLERAHLPNDMHAWAKIYTGSDIGSYVGPGVTFSNNTATFCNVSLGVDEPPLMRVAGGAFVNWAVTEFNQCTEKGKYNADGDPDRPASSKDYTVRVQVCNSNAASNDARERFCSQYGSGYKPTGLLQQFGESGRLRFGLVSGTYSKPRAGGVLRKNIGLFAGNGSDPAVCVEGDEVKLSDGTFCNTGDNQQGIVNTLRRFKLVGWAGTGTKASWNGPAAGATWTSDCGTFGARNRTNPGSGGILIDPGAGTWQCTPWGNPVAEMYSEALRYIAGESKGSTNFLGDIGADIQAAQATWVDPYGVKKEGSVYGGNPYCASCSVLILSSGSPSYDSEVPAVANLGISADAATKALGDVEGINGKNFFVGSVAGRDAGMLADSSNFVCDSVTVGDLSYVRGICDDSPQREGTYLVAGLARAAYMADLRSNNIANKPATAKVNVTTFAVELADTMPKIDIRTGAGIVSLTPYCKANPTPSEDGKILPRTCQLGDTLAGKQVSTTGKAYVYGRDITATGGSYMFSWDGASLGEANDRDFTYMLTYCVGSACLDDTNPQNNSDYRGYDICWATANDSASVCGSDGRPSVGPNDVLVRTEMISASSGNPAMMGFSAAGSTRDGIYKQVLRKGPPVGGGAVYNLLNGATPDVNKYPMQKPDVDDAVWELPKVAKLTPAGRASASLQSPLWYAAKYGTSTGDLDMDGQPDWDQDGDGQPDNYLKARNPSKLKSELARIIGKVSDAAPVTGGAASGVRLTQGSSITLVSSFKLSAGGNDWNGDLVAYDLNLDGTQGSQRWSAASGLTAQAAAKQREFRVSIQPTIVNQDTGAVVAAFKNAWSFSGAVDMRNADGKNRTVRQLFGLGDTDSAWLGNVSDDKLLEYLGGAYNGPPFRKRPSLLGDIVNSSVEVLTSKDDYGYAAWSNQADKEWKKTLGAAYSAHLERKRNAAEFSTVLVGANDGMVHGFSLATGRERVAYISSYAREQIGQLTNPSYRHQFFADGEISAGDMYLDGRFWTMAIAAMGGGGKSVLGLAEGSTSGGSGKWGWNWELRGTEGGHKLLDDLGYVFGRPVIVPVTGSTAGGPPRWVALFGNGVNSYTGGAALFVVDAGSGAILARLKPSGAGYSVKNGLFNIAPVALYNNDGVVDTVYGADLQGNVWKFDLSSVSPANWNVAFGGKPLFTATDDNGAGQAITGGLEVSRGPGGGTVVTFGTGRYFAIGDNIVPTNPQVQSFYGIYDRCTTATGCTANITDGRTQLTRQTVTEGKASDGYLTRNISDNAPGRNGWYVDLRIGDTPGTGERFIGIPRLQNGKVFFVAYQPLGDDCRAGGRNWRYAVDMLTGGGAMAGVSTQPGGTPICTGNCGGVNPAQENAPPQTKPEVLIPPPPLNQLVGCGAEDPNCSKRESLTEALAQQRCSMILSVPNAPGLYMPRPCGRQSWRQVR